VRFFLRGGPGSIFFGRRRPGYRNVWSSFLGRCFSPLGCLRPALSPSRKGEGVVFFAERDSIRPVSSLPFNERSEACSSSRRCAAPSRQSASPHQSYPYPFFVPPWLPDQGRGGGDLPFSPFPLKQKACCIERRGRGLFFFSSPESFPLLSGKRPKGKASFFWLRLGLTQRRSDSDAWVFQIASLFLELRSFAYTQK